MFGLVLRPKIGVIMVDQKNPPWYTSIKFYVGIQKVNESTFMMSTDKMNLTKKSH